MENLKNLDLENFQKKIGDVEIGTISFENDFFMTFCGQVKVDSTSTWPQISTCAPNLKLQSNLKPDLEFHFEVRLKWKIDVNFAHCITSFHM